MCGFNQILRSVTFFFLFLVALLSSACIFANPAEEVPVFYKGRFRPFNVYAKLWLYDIYHKQSINSGSPMDFLWKINFDGTTDLENTPLFWIHYADTKQKLGFNLKQDRFSYREIMNAINPEFLKGLTAYFYYQSGKTGKKEITELSPDLWVSRGKIIKVPETGLFSVLKPGDSLPDAVPNKLEVEESLNVLNHVQQFKQWNQGLILRMLPSKKQLGDWLPISILAKKGANPTAYNDELYEALQNAYERRDISQLADLLQKGYETQAGKVYQEANGKALVFPTLGQLKAETIYYTYPLIEITTLLYGIGILFFFFGYPRGSLWSIGLAFLIHTGVLAMRCYILNRPPVSNMFETVIYVPWITVLIGFAFKWVLRSGFVLAAASFAAMALLIVLKIANLNSSMENVQAVLDSQYWLIIHVLLVVGSYGLFILSGILGQIYLIKYLCECRREKISNGSGDHLEFRRRGISHSPERKPWEGAHHDATRAGGTAFLPQAILQSMYIGVAMLIPGTILGGVWAAESWGRFWDWDPKESWAFISSCIYIMVIHAYTFKHIANFGLAMGSILGLLAISFTWYGVNYILGSGLHSYGFGTGGEWIYYSFLAVQVLFLALATYYHRSNKKFISI